MSHLSSSKRRIWLWPVTMMVWWCQTSVMPQHTHPWLFSLVQKLCRVEPSGWELWEVVWQDNPRGNEGAERWPWTYWKLCTGCGSKVGQIRIVPEAHSTISQATACLVRWDTALELLVIQMPSDRSWSADHTGPGRICNLRNLWSISNRWRGRGYG